MRPTTGRLTTIEDAPVLDASMDGRSEALHEERKARQTTRNRAGKALRGPK